MIKATIHKCFKTYFDWSIYKIFFWSIN